VRIIIWTGRHCRRRQCWLWLKRKHATGPASAPKLRQNRFKETGKNLGGQAAERQYQDIASIRVPGRCRPKRQRRKCGSASAIRKKSGSESFVAVVRCCIKNLSFSVNALAQSRPDQRGSGDFAKTAAKIALSKSIISATVVEDVECKFH
jgi:hypothetical protein